MIIYDWWVYDKGFFCTYAEGSITPPPRLKCNESYMFTPGVIPEWAQ